MTLVFELHKISKVKQVETARDDLRPVDCRCGQVSLKISPFSDFWHNSAFIYNQIPSLKPNKFAFKRSQTMCVGFQIRWKVLRKSFEPDLWVEKNIPLWRMFVGNERKLSNQLWSLEGSVYFQQQPLFLENLSFSVLNSWHVCLLKQPKWFCPLPASILQCLRGS